MNMDTNSTITQCAAYVQGKKQAKSFTKCIKDTINEISDLIVSDVWGPSNTEGPIGKCYY